MRRLGFILLGCVVAVAMLVMLDGCSGQQRTQSLDDKAQEIYRSLMCPLCPGQTIDQSQTKLSAQMRALVREKLEQGDTKAEILRFFAERYGEAVLAAPVKSGFNLIVWLTPIAGILIGGVVLWLVIRKWVSGGRESSPGPVSLTPNDTDDEKYRSQLEKDLKDFDGRGFR